MLEKIRIDNIYQFLLILLAFLMPLTVFGANLIIVIIVTIWLFSGDYQSKYKLIITNNFLIASIIFFSIHVIGLIWTEDLLWGLEIVHKMWYFLLLLPVLYTIVQERYIKHYVTSFLVAMSFTEVISYLVWFQIIPPFKYAYVHDPTPFMSHVSYNPILAFAIYLLTHKLFFNKNLSLTKFFMYSFFSITMTINMFITGGRAGQVMYFAMLVMLIFQFFNSDKLKSLIAISILIPGIFYTAYQTSDQFQLRVNSAVTSTFLYEKNTNTSVGQRLTFAINSWEIIKKNPLIGVGTGDLPKEYKKVNMVNSPQNPNTTNTHNMYTLVGIQLGVLGVFSMLTIFYYQVKLSYKSTNRFIRDTGITLPLLFLLIMWSDSYLLGHYTTLMYVFFSSFLYRDFDKK